MLSGLNVCWQVHKAIPHEPIKLVVFNGYVTPLLRDY